MSIGRRHNTLLLPETSPTNSRTLYILAGFSYPMPEKTATRAGDMNSYDLSLPHPRACPICLLIPRCLGGRATKDSRKRQQSMGDDTYLALRIHTTGYLRRLRSSAVCIPSQGNSHPGSPCSGTSPSPTLIFWRTIKDLMGLPSDLNKKGAVLDYRPLLTFAFWHLVTL